MKSWDAKLDGLIKLAGLISELFIEAVVVFEDEAVPVIEKASSILDGLPFLSKYLRAARTFSLLSLNLRTLAATSAPFLTLKSFTPLAAGSPRLASVERSYIGIAKPKIAARSSALVAERNKLFITKSPLWLRLRRTLR